MEKAPRTPISEKTLREFVYDQEVMCRAIIVKYELGPESEEDQEVIRFEPAIDDIALEDKLYEMPTEHKLNIHQYAKPLFMAAKLLDLEIKDYITNAEIVTYVVNNDLNSSKKLKNNNPFIHSLAVERGLIKKIFPRLKRCKLGI